MIFSDNVMNIVSVNSCCILSKALYMEVSIYYVCLFLDYLEHVSLWFASHRRGRSWEDFNCPCNIQRLTRRFQDMYM